MDIVRAIGETLPRVERDRITPAVIGGFAIGLPGEARTTVDLDLLVHRDDLPRIDPLRTALGYALRFRSENVSRFASPQDVFGDLVLLHAYRPPALAMLERAIPVPLPGSATAPRVVTPTDLIGLKLQALKNDPAGRPLDRSDVVGLLRRYRSRLDQSLLDEYADALDAAGLLAELRQEAGC